MKNYRAIFIDIDGTLKNDNGEISQNTINIIKQITETGTLTILCSGRNKVETVEVSKMCGASPYIIIFNGAEIYDYEKNEIIYQSSIPQEEIGRIYELTKGYKLQLIVSTDENKTNYQQSKNSVDLSKVLECRLKVEDLQQRFEMRKILRQLNGVKAYELLRSGKKVVFKTEDADKLDYFIMKENISKWEAIKMFCIKKGISTEDIIAIGDGENDIEMLKGASIGVAMGNAARAVKENADIITLSNNDEGVAVFLEKLCKIYNKINNEKGER